MPYLNVFAIYFYGDIPTYLGGGKPVDVRLLVNSEETQKQLEPLGISFTKNKCLTTNVKLLYVSDTEYAVLTDKDAKTGKTRAITIKKDIVNAVYYIPALQ